MSVVVIDGTTVRSFVEDVEQFTKTMDERFTALDLNSDGVLSPSELRKAFESMRIIEAHFGLVGVSSSSPSPSEEELTKLYDSIFERFDVDKSDTVDKDEFRAEMKKILLAIADGLGDSPIQMVVEDDENSLIKKAADLEASKIGNS